MAVDGSSEIVNIIIDVRRIVKGDVGDFFVSDAGDS